LLARANDLPEAEKITFNLELEIINYLAKYNYKKPHTTTKYIPKDAIKLT